jgi:MFS family permease
MTEHRPAPPVARWLPPAVVVTCFLFALVGRGTAETFGVFLLPLQQGFGWDRAQVTGIYAVAALAVGSAGPMVGYLSDHLGPRALYLVGAAALVLAYAGAAAATELWHLYLTLGICVGFASACLGNVAQTPLIAIWFRGRVGTVLGIVGGATGIGALILAPAAQLLIETRGYRFAFAGLAAVALLLVVPLLVLPWKRIAAGRDGLGIGPIAQNWSLARAMTEPVLWAMFAVYFLTSTAISVMQPQMVAYLIEVGIAPLAAATAVGFAGLSASAGMVLFGWLADRLGRRWTLTLSYATTAMGLGVLSLMSIWPSPLLLVAYVLTFGLSLGSRGPLIAALAQRIYAGSTLGRVLGFLLIGMGTGTAFGAWLGGELHDHVGGYHANFIASWTAIALALAPWWISKNLRRL